VTMSTIQDTTEEAARERLVRDGAIDAIRLLGEAGIEAWLVDHCGDPECAVCTAGLERERVAA
jgi:hypothetical protein